MRRARLLMATVLVAGAVFPAAAQETGFGPSPALPPPKTSLIPTVNVARVDRWPAGEKPDAGRGFTVERFADGLDHPRWLYVLPNGDVLVAETNAPPKRDHGRQGLRHEAGAEDRRRRRAQRQPDHAAARRRRRRRGRDAQRLPAATCTRPSAWPWSATDFYVANTDAVVRFPYQPGQTEDRRPSGIKLADLPGGPINHHWTKSLVASPDGTKLYVGVGSNSNVAENGIDAEESRAAILEIDRATGAAQRLRLGPAQSRSGWTGSPRPSALWVAVNERDELGDDLVPDYMTAVQPGAFYGWPYSYYGQHVDTRVDAAAPGAGRQGDRSRLRPGRPHRFAGTDLLRRRCLSRALSRRRLHRPARLLEPLARRPATR